MKSVSIQKKIFYIDFIFFAVFRVRQYLIKVQKCTKILEYRQIRKGYSQMNETYIELLVKKRENRTLNSLHSVLVFVGVVCFIIGLFSTFILTITGLLIELIAYLLQMNSNIEYEYLYLDKELAIDKIKNQAKRKKVAKYNVQTLHVMAPVGSAHLSRYESLKVHDYSAPVDGQVIYEMILDGENGQDRIRLNTTQELLNGIKMCAPRAIYHE